MGRREKSIKLLLALLLSLWVLLSFLHCDPGLKKVQFCWNNQGHNFFQTNMNIHAMLDT